MKYSLKVGINPYADTTDDPTMIIHCEDASITTNDFTGRTATTANAAVNTARTALEVQEQA